MANIKRGQKKCQRSADVLVFQVIYILTRVSAYWLGIQFICKYLRMC